MLPDVIMRLNQAALCSPVLRQVISLRSIRCGDSGRCAKTQKMMPKKGMDGESHPAIEETLRWKT